MTTLKIKQLELFPTSPAYIAKDMAMGQMFLYKSKLCLRTKPVAWMLNSTLIQDKITQGYIMFVELETGKVSWISGKVAVEPVTGTLSWSK